MKKRALSLLAVLALALSLCVPATAAQDFGLAYDDTDLLDTDFLRTLAYDTLQPMTNDYDAQFRLDVMMDVSQEEAQSVAEYLYTEYDYGDGEDKAGVLLLLGLDPDDTGLTFRSFTLLAKGYAANIVTGQVKTDLETLLAAYFNADMWVGDLETDQHTFEVGMTEYTKKLNEVFLAAEDTEASPLTTETAPAEDTPAQDVSTQSFVYDEADLLSDSEEASLEDAARTVSQTYGCGVYMAAVDNYLDYSTVDVYEAAKTFYRQNNLGMGESSTGILLFLSMADRDYWLVAYGDQAHAAFTDYGKEAMAEAFLDDFGSNDWYNGFADYIDICGEYLSLEQAGTPVDVGSEPVAEELSLGEQITGSLLMAVVPALVIATIFCLIARAKMKSAKIGTEAWAYVTKNGVHLTVNEDHYLRTTVTRTPRPKNNDNGGGGTSIGSDGFSGSGGKF